MDKKKQQLIITGVLLVVMVIMMGKTLFGGKKDAAPSGAFSSSVSAETMASNMTFLVGVRLSESARLLQDAEWQKPWGRDPFDALDLSGAVTVGGQNNFALSGIVWDDKFPMAIINDKLFQAGDLIDACQVKEIRRGSVSVVCEGKSFDLQLFRVSDTDKPGSQ